ncbi:protein dcd1B-like [Pomacea canaliculata]|uniref:protein dcd1B-like n=1 Tax=Pomacea canaliculata TaxID=400727 RepID=UPI000D72D75B|nr:protein dcd1B-like [Pomacea canaliculata]
MASLTQSSAQSDSNLLRVATTGNTISNGKHYIAGEGEDAFDIIHIWGTPYEMGRAHGLLMGDKVKIMADAVWSYLEQQIIDPINRTIHLQEWFLEDVANFGLDVALDLELLATDKYTGDYFFEEARGLAEAAGIDYKKLLRIHMIGELTKGSCSMVGAWGGSVSTPDSLLQLRALDWVVDGPFKEHPQVTVYHPTNVSNGHAFANFGWTSWIGSITGMSSQRMAISEIGVSFPDESFGKESRFGIPFTFVLRDILQFDKTLNDSIKRITEAHRTCDLILGVGDGKEKEFRGIQYSASVANFFTDTNLEPKQDWHPRITDIVYFGMDWLCPGYSEVLARQLTLYHGNLTAELLMREVVPIVQTGSLQVAVYNLTSNMVLLANARASYETGPDNAYERQYVELNMTELFEEKPPSNSIY